MKKNVREKYPLIITAIILLIAVILYTILKFPLPNFRDTPLQSLNGLYVDFIDVGHGDCILISEGEKHILIDTGNPDTADDVLLFLSRRKIHSLDLIIATHPHLDHIGGFDQISDFIQIKEVIMPDLPSSVLEKDAVANDFDKKLKSAGIPFRKVSSRLDIETGDIALNILHADTDSNDTNEHSLIVKLCYGETSFLFMGDCEKNAEAVLLKSSFDLNADVLKVGHHASKNSATQEFLDAVCPKYAVITTEPANSLGHPSSEAISRIYKTGAIILRTDIDSSIYFYTDGKALKYKTEK